MKKIITIIAVFTAFIMTAKADDRPVTFEQLPAPAQAFITQNYPGDKVSYATVDDDIISPDYTVVLVSGVRLQFEHKGSIEKIESRAGVSEELIPVQIVDYVKRTFPDATFQEYEVGRFGYEVKLSNRMELKFNRKFAVVGLDD